MNTSTPVKISNNELFAKTLAEYPPVYNLQDTVHTSMGVAFVNGCTFNERTVKETLQEWKDEVRHQSNWDRYMNR